MFYYNATMRCVCAQAALAWWSTVSPFSPYGPTIALVFVLLVAAGKAIIEDKKRHTEDRITNNSTAHVVLPDGAGTIHLLSEVSSMKFLVPWPACLGRLIAFPVPPDSLSRALERAGLAKGGHLLLASAT